MYLKQLKQPLKQLVGAGSRTSLGRQPAAQFSGLDLLPTTEPKVSFMCFSLPAKETLHFLIKAVSDGL